VSERPIVKYRPSVEGLESKQLLSGLGTQTASAHAAASLRSTVRESVDHKPTTGFLVYRITNPDRFNNTLKPPFQHVFVQSQPPIPGQVYNILYIVVRNGTAQTFEANSNFQVKLAGQSTPTQILTGDQQWKPGEQFVFYVLTKKYYPIANEVTSGFEFNLEGARSISIPGPSGIVQRIKYNPRTFDRTLDSVVAFGPGNQGGKGAKFGLPNTAINEFVSAKTNRIDFGGYF
jgi:hypothetical protein